MTRPLFEPSTQRHIRSQGFTGDQLLRRPPPPGSEDKPWARIEKTYASSLQSVTGANGFNDVHCGGSGDVINIGTGESGEGVFDEYVAGGNLIGLTTLMSGVYLVKCELTWNEAHNFQWGLGITDSSPTGHYSVGLQNPAQSVFGMSCEYHRYPNNQTFIFTCFQGSGVNKNIDAAFMEAIRIGDYSGAEYTTLDPDQ